MDFSKRVIILGVLQAFVSVIFALYIESLASGSGKLLIVGEALSAYSNSVFLDHPVIFVIVLSLFSIFIYVLSHWSQSQKKERLLYNRICKHIFDEVIKKNEHIQNKNCRVSFLKVRKTRRCDKWYRFDMITKNSLVVFGRHQTKQGKRYSKLRFYAGEGLAGISYEINSAMSRSIEPFDVSNENEYFQESSDKLKLPEKKAKKLNVKACSFICVPISYFGTDDVIGVISVDSMLKSEFDGALIREIERIAVGYSPIFSLN